MQNQPRLFLKIVGEKSYIQVNNTNIVFRYDYIGKLETFDEDMNYIIDKQFPLKRGKGSKRNMNVLAAEEPDDGGFHKELDEYRNCSSDLVNSVTQRYQRDLHQFGYTFDYVDGKYYAGCQGDCC